MSAVDMAGPAPARRPDVPALAPAATPPEARGLARDEVRLLVAGDGGLRHVLFRDLGAWLSAGDVVVVNTSATVPACVDGRRADGREVRVHLSTPLGGDRWLVELREPGGGRVRDARAGERVALPEGIAATLIGGHPDARRREGSRLWNAAIPLTRFAPAAAASPEKGALAYLHAVGRPISYAHAPGRWPLAAYQTVFGRHPGSAEMPSAGRPFTAELLADLAVRGVVVAPVLLHAGVSSLESGEAPLAERYRVSPATARLVNQARAAGARVVAVGTTVTRALETVASADGRVAPGEGWTTLVLGPERPARAVDVLITGWHDPLGSHVALLEAVAGAATVEAAHRSAAAHGYLAHEFGDACMLLAGPEQRTGHPRR